MTKSTKKLLLYLVVSDQNIDYEIVPAPDSIFNDKEFLVAQYDIDTTVRNQIKIRLKNKQQNTHYVQINSVVLNSITLTDLNLFSTYVTENGQIKKTNGWLDEVGCCTITIRADAPTQNILTYLLSKNETNLSELRH
jgi:hypothetical protein